MSRSFKRNVVENENKHYRLNKKEKKFLRKFVRSKFKRIKHEDFPRNISGNFFKRVLCYDWASDRGYNYEYIKIYRGYNRKNKYDKILFRK